jgi:hypothetical protein
LVFIGPRPGPKTVWPHFIYGDAVQSQAELESRWLADRDRVAPGSLPKCLVRTKQGVHVTS